MARPLRLEFPGAVYHVTARGNARAATFADDDDRRCFLGLLAGVVERFGWLCHAYCLMGDHYHLLIETPKANLSRGMRQLNGVYTQRFNRRHGRVGHLFQGRFKAILVEKDSHLLELCRYVVLNPVRAKITRRADAHPWSSYAATAGSQTAPGFLTIDWVLAQFGRQRSRAQLRYREFVAEGAESPWPALKGQVLLGGEAFVEKLAPALEEKEQMQEIPRTQRQLSRPSLARLLPASVGKDGDRERRDQLIREAHVAYGYTLLEIGRQVGLHYATVSKVVNRQQK